MRPRQLVQRRSGLSAIAGKSLPKAWNEVGGIEHARCLQRRHTAPSAIPGGDYLAKRAAVIGGGVAVPRRIWCRAFTRVAGGEGRPRHEVGDDLYSRSPSHSGQNRRSAANWYSGPDPDAQGSWVISLRGSVSGVAASSPQHRSARSVATLPAAAARLHQIAAR
jgi:hypothetical protein